MPVHLWELLQPEYLDSKFAICFSPSINVRVYACVFTYVCASLCVSVSVCVRACMCVLKGLVQFDPRADYTNIHN